MGTAGAYGGVFAGFSLGAWMWIGIAIVGIVVLAAIVIRSRRKSSWVRSPQEVDRLDKIDHIEGRPRGFRDLPLDSSRERVRCIRCRCRFGPVDGLREGDNDPICALCDRVGGVGPLGLHEPV